MNHYIGYGLKIESEINFPELESKSTAIPSNNLRNKIKIHLKKLNPSSEDLIFKGDNFRITTEGIYLLWDDIGTFKISSGSEITVDSINDVDERELRKCILGPSLAILFFQRGLLVLHASAVNINNYAVAFVGYAGSGKSTLASYLNHNGHPIVTDDVLVIHHDDPQPQVIPGFPQLKLSREVIKNTFQIKETSHFISKTNKMFIPANGFFNKSPLPLKHVYVLKTDEKIGIDLLNPRDSVIELIKHSYCLPLFNNSEKSKNLSQCAKLSKNIPIKRLRVNRSFKLLPQIIDLLKSDINK